MNKIVALYVTLVSRLEALFRFEDYGLLFLRIWVGLVFYQSSRTKVDGTGGFLSPSEVAVYLFEDDYGFSGELFGFSLAETFAQLAVYFETLLPIFLLAGLASRFASLALLGMTMVIQFYVYPGSFMEHAGWAAALLAILALGPGRISLDYPIRRQVEKTG